MAVLADIGCLYVRQILAGCLCAIVTTDAVTSDVQVIEVRWQPANGAVTVIAGIAAGDMCWMLADRSDAIVAGAAGAYYLGVIDRQHGRKQIRRVAIFADIGRLNVGGVLADCIRAVVTADAIARDIDVIEVRW